MKLSYSAISKYQECPFKYKLHYIDRLRQNYLSSPLIFGSAFDKVSTMILEDFGKEQRDYAIEFATAYYILTEAGDAIKFSKSDCDLSLIPEHLLEGIENVYQLKAKEVLDSSRQYEVEQNMFYDLCCVSQKEKGILLLAEFKNWVYDNVASVISMQDKVEFANEEGDSFEGYIDFICTLKNGKTVIMDLKTSSNPNKYYTEGSADISPQLTIYSQGKEIKDVGYIVLDKTIRKKEPRVRFKEVYGTITEEQVSKTFNDIDDALHKIRAEEFPKNEDSCNNFGGCPYRAYCKSNFENMEGLCYKTTQEVKRD
jgi:hypothetical protein